MTGTAPKMSVPTMEPPPSPSPAPSSVSVSPTECLRRLAQEARIVLVSLRNGPPHSPLIPQLTDFLAHPTLTLDPFLAVITHPDAAGPHTLTALQCVQRLQPILSYMIPTTSSPVAVCEGILACQFEQTDHGVDEAVEMAIADTLATLQIQEQSTETFMDAFHTVFVTRHTFCHRPAMAYHLTSRVLRTLVDQAATVPETRRAVLEFLVHPLLHTPLLSGSGGGSGTLSGGGLSGSGSALNVTVGATSTDGVESSEEQRWLCLRLLRRFVHVTARYQDPAVIALLQDDVCLSLLMTGQAALQGRVRSMVLQEIVGVVEELWQHYQNTMAPAMEALWTGLYTRALVQVREQKQQSQYHKSEEDPSVRIVLESLADILTFHDHGTDAWGTLKTLFRNYDCHLQRPNVATHLVLELSRCCGGSASAASAEVEWERSMSADSVGTAPELVERTIPVAMTRLCARALQASMQCLFQDDHASPETLVLRQQRQRSCLNGQHPLQRLKFHKRQLAQAARVFNRKSTTGLSMLQDCRGTELSTLDVATFLREGLVVGLAKPSVGEYLGTAGKANAMVPWEGADFHAEVLTQYCALFDFESQSLLDALRMFLAAFRLPGEAQQIDRILQAFADRCSRVCDERNGIFSQDPKKASDAAYLLSFSIIMLNTDRHNANIREDRKMSLDDFVKNNTDYGKDISDKPFPREYLAGIYESINQEEIRTEGEGAEGAMTVERWKDVLRSGSSSAESAQTEDDAEDLTELVLEYTWRPIVAAIGGLWEDNAGTPRMGIDMSVELLQGVRRLGRKDIFCKIFASLCDFSGLLGDYRAGPEDRLRTFCNSIESQAAVVVVVQTVVSAAEDLNEDCWKRVWFLLSELRDLKLLPRTTLQQESESDFLTPTSRANWTQRLELGDMECQLNRKERGSGKSLLGAFGRAIFGPVEEELVDTEETPQPSSHGKENLVVWDDFADSDDEDDDEKNPPEGPSTPVKAVGMQFEEMLVSEAATPATEDVPVTGLERMEDNKNMEHSIRYRVRERLHRLCDFKGLIAESRFLDDDCIETLFQSLVGVAAVANDVELLNSPQHPEPPPSSMERAESDISVSTGASVPSSWTLPLSPGSEAFVEVLIAELAIKNRDRLKSIWLSVLRDHYVGQLTSLFVNETPESTATKIPADPGLEKRITGLLRLCSFAVQRPDIANEVLSVWKFVLPVTEDQHASSPLRALHKHIGEGLWRIAVQVERLGELQQDGWEGLIALIHWCGKRGSMLKPLEAQSPRGLPEDDTALQSYRALHLLLHTEDLSTKVPWTVVWSLRCLVAAGSRRHYGQLSMASLDLLGVLHEKTTSVATEDCSFWTSGWTKIVEGIAEAAELANDTVRCWVCPFQDPPHSLCAVTEHSPACSFDADRHVSAQERKSDTGRAVVSCPWRHLRANGRTPYSWSAAARSFRGNVRSTHDGVRTLHWIDIQTAEASPGVLNCKWWELPRYLEVGSGRVGETAGGEGIHKRRGSDTIEASRYHEQPR